MDRTTYRVFLTIMPLVMIAVVVALIATLILSQPPQRDTTSTVVVHQLSAQ